MFGVHRAARKEVLPALASARGRMEFRILGPLEVSEHGRILKVGPPKQRALLAILLLHANEVLAPARLIHELWGENPPRTARQTLWVYISQLRKRLPANGPGHIVATEPAGYLVRLQRNQLDATRFAALAADGGNLLAAENLQAAAQRLREALSLWRGPALADFHYEPFAWADGARLDELRLVCLERRMEADLQLGCAAELVGELEALVAEHPWRESLRRQLMLAFYWSGGQADALAAYRQTRSLLVDELGIEPSTALRELHTGMLRQDSRLDRAMPSVPELAPTSTRFLGGEMRIEFCTLPVASITPTSRARRLRLRLGAPATR